EWDTAIWINIATLPNTPHANQFYREIEQWALANYTGSYATMRVEWSKGWAYTDQAGWADSTMLQTTIPNMLRDGQATNSNWDTEHTLLDKYDPFRIFTSPLQDKLGI
ncbi:MAG: FAD-linked oxidase, partial [Glaciimonas sp.]|nr:FAD-linked oxidase [Glaciimonas sp.]